MAELVKEQKEIDFTDLIATEKLKDEKTRKYIENAFRDGIVKTSGTEFDKLMPPVSCFGGATELKSSMGL